MVNVIYQKRYLDHQKRKKEVLMRIIKDRYSERYFSDKEIEFSKIKLILKAADMVPSSCNRKAIKYLLIEDRNSKEILGGFLVGGVGWIHRAKSIILLSADKEAYVENLDYMPYLDAGIVIQQIWLTATALDLGCAYINPNVRDGNQDFFRERFHLKENHIFCGAIALGYKHP